MRLIFRRFLLVSAIAFPLALPGLVFAGLNNKVITRTYRWQISSIPRFDIYHYDKAGENMLPYSSLYLARAYARVTRVLPASPKKPFPFFLYNTHNEFEQTNITSVGEGTGGVTEAFKDRLLVGHLGSQRYLEYIISHEFTHEIEFEYLFAGFWRSIRLLKFIIYPHWLMEGLAEYTSDDLDRATREMYLRDAATTGRLLPMSRLEKFNHVLPHQVTLAYKESGALMRYLADEYGEETLARMLAAYTEHFDASTVLRAVYGTDAATIDRKFREFLEDKYTREAEGLDEPDVYGERLTPKGAYPRFYQGGIFSPDGKSVAYITDGSGSNSIQIMDLASRRVTDLRGVLHAAGIEEISTEGNPLAFSPDGSSLCFSGERLQKDYLYLYHAGRKRIEEIATRTDTIVSPAVSPDADEIYFSGLQEGFRNLFSYRRSDGAVLRLTSGPGDVIDAAPGPDNNLVYCAAERANPSGRMEYDLCRLDRRDGSLTFITDEEGDERSPALTPDGAALVFSSDRDGVTDLYTLSIDSGAITRLTRVAGGNFQPRVSPDGNTVLFSSFRRGQRHLYAGGRQQFLSSDPAPVAPASDVSIGRQPDIDWPVNSRPRPYRFRASTDLFFPAVFYSSLDGLFLATYWQASEFLGNHQFQGMVNYGTGSEYLNYQVVYGFLKYRPQFYLTFSGNDYFYDIDRTLKRRDRAQILTAVYPLNRDQSVQLLAGTVDREEIWPAFPVRDIRRRENVAGAAFLHDNTRGPYLEATSGARLLASYMSAGGFMRGDYDYRTGTLQTGFLFPLGREHVLDWRTLSGASIGPDADVFRLGGIGRVRGVPENGLFAGSRIFVNTFEWRYPLAHDINYHMWYFFPDFFFKTLYGTAFLDTGVAVDSDSQLRRLTADDWNGGYGIGLRVHTFILQLYPLLLELQGARAFDGRSAAVYISLGGTF